MFPGRSPIQKGITTSRFVQADMRTECSLLICFGNWDLQISTGKVKGWKIDCPWHWVQWIVDFRQRVTILNRDVVYFTIVNANFSKPNVLQARMTGELHGLIEVLVMSCPNISFLWCSMIFFWSYDTRRGACRTGGVEPLTLIVSWHWSHAIGQCVFLQLRISQHSFWGARSIQHIELLSVRPSEPQNPPT